MATVTAINGPLDTKNLGYRLGSIDILQVTSTHVRFLNGPLDYLDFYGSFDLSPGGSGTITDIQNTVNAVRTSYVSGANADAQTLFGLIQAGSGAEAYLLRDGDTIEGGSDRDTLFGYGGRDTLQGAGGDDRISGGSAADTLVGGAGRDMLRGGGGRDTFVYSSAADSTTQALARDTILDFSHAARDRIDLSAIDANAQTASQNDAFTFVTAFGDHAGEMRVREVAAGWLVQADLDGDGGADFAILVKSDGPLLAGDFIL